MRSITYHLLAALVLGAGVLMTACKSDVNSNEVVEAIPLDGLWVFDKAYRNKKQTNTLDNGYFDFRMADSTIYSNIFTGKQPYKFTCTVDELRITGAENMKFNVENYATDSLTLQGKLGPFDMNLWLVKKDSFEIDSTLYN